MSTQDYTTEELDRVHDIVDDFFMKSTDYSTLYDQDEFTEN